MLKKIFKLFSAVLFLGNITACSNSDFDEDIPAYSFCSENRLASARIRTKDIGSALVPKYTGTIVDISPDMLYLDKSLHKLVMVHSNSARRMPDGRVETWVRIGNCTNFMICLEGRTSFLNRNRTTAEPIGQWERFCIHPQASNGFHSVSRKKVDTYMTEFRRVDADFGYKDFFY